MIESLVIVVAALVHQEQVESPISAPAPSARSGLPSEGGRHAAEGCLRVYSDAHLDALRGAVKECGGDAGLIDEAIQRYTRCRDSAVIGVATLLDSDPGDQVYAEDIARRQADHPRGEIWDPSKAEVSARHSRRVEQAARDASEAAGIPVALYAIGRKHSTAVLDLASSVREVVMPRESAVLARRISWRMLGAYEDAPDPAKAQPAAFLDTVDVFAMWTQAIEDAVVAEPLKRILVVQGPGVPISGTDAVLAAADRMLEDDASCALVNLRATPQDDPLAVWERRCRAYGRRWVAADALLDALIAECRAHGAAELAGALRASYLVAVAPTVMRPVWLESDAAACLESLRATGVLSQVAHDAAAASVQARAVALRASRDRLVELGLAARAAVGTQAAAARRSAVVSAMAQFDAEVAAATKQFASSLPANWQGSLPKDLGVRASRITVKESCMDEDAARQAQR